MERFLRVEGVAVWMPRDDVDTDAILPVRYMKSMDEDFGKGLFANLRYDPDGLPNPRFELNKPEYAKAAVLISGDNFGCGSSREHAVWALRGYGFRCVVAKGFGDIFYNNCFRMGLLPLVLPSESVDRLGSSASRLASSGSTTVVDLVSREIVGPDEHRYPFEVDALRRRMLLEGVDGIGLSLLYEDAIAAYQAREGELRSWIHFRRAAAEETSQSPVRSDH